MAKNDNKKRPFYLFSRANHPVRIVYNGKVLVLPPFASKFKLADESLLGDLPKEVRKVAIMEVK